MKRLLELKLQLEAHKWLSKAIEAEHCIPAAELSRALSPSRPSGLSTWLVSIELYILYYVKVFT